MSSETRRFIAIVGDRFMNGGFFPMEELRKCHKIWERTLHDINHEGTSAGTFKDKTDITKFIGYHQNVILNEEDKTVSMELVPVKETASYNAWKGFVTLMEKAGRTVNVSVTYFGKRRMTKASELPNDEYKKLGFSEEDSVPVLYDVIPWCVSTVLEGRCSDKGGCGFNATVCKCTLDKPAEKPLENPEPSPGESEKDFIGRCIPFIKNEHPDWEQDQIVATCYSIWRRKHESASFESFMEKLGYEKLEESVPLTCVNDKKDDNPTVDVTVDKSKKLDEEIEKKKQELIDWLKKEDNK
jgi:hypothetical protein